MGGYWKLIYCLKLYKVSLVFCQRQGLNECIFPCNSLAFAWNNVLISKLFSDIFLSSQVGGVI